MTGIVFWNTLRNHWRSGIYYGIGIAFLGVYVLIAIPNVDMLKQYAELVASLPPAMLQLFGMGDAAQLATPAGFLGFAFFGYTVLILSAYGVIAGLNVTANEEDRGILDVVLSLPIPRWRLVVERLLAFALIVVVLLAVIFAAMWLALQSNSALNIDLTRLFEGVVNILPSTLLVLAFTALMGTLLRSRGMAAAVAAAFVIISYFINFIGEAASETAAAALRVVSYFSYYGGGDIMNTGLIWGNVIVLLVAAAICVVGTLWCFERRDIGL